jgi:hypothetical protein
MMRKLAPHLITSPHHLTSSSPHLLTHAFQAWARENLSFYIATLFGGD